LDGLESQLPSDMIELKSLLMDVLINFTLFEERSKEAIMQLVDEKHRLLNRCRVYEKAAQIPNREEGDRYLHHLQYWQDENEQQSLRIADLKVL
jgi:hypothetical protein